MLRRILDSAWYPKLTLEMLRFVFKILLISNEIRTSSRNLLLNHMQRIHEMVLAKVKMSNAPYGSSINHVVKFLDIFFSPSSLRGQFYKIRFILLYGHLANPLTLICPGGLCMIFYHKVLMKHCIVWGGCAEWLPKNENQICILQTNDFGEIN